MGHPVMNLHTLAPFSSNVPHHPITLTTPEQILHNLPTLVPGWSTHPPSGPSPKVEPISGGITNQIYKASLPDHSPVLVRIFGAKDVFTTAQRHEENLIFEQLGRVKIAPSLVSVFQNGRVERFLNFRPITLDEMTAPHVLTGVASAVARLHKFVPQQSTPPVVRVWDDIENWAAKAVQFHTSHAFPEPFGLDMDLCVNGLQHTKKSIQNDTTSPVVYSHNDLLAGNILLSLGDNRSIALVDFEYSSFNYRGFDIANFFAEAMGGTDDGYVDSARYPSAADRTVFCTMYLQETRGSKPSEGEVRALVDEAERFALVSHLYWGFWALVQSVSSDVAFPYVKFAEQRFGQFFKRRDADMA